MRPIALIGLIGFGALLIWGQSVAGGRSSQSATGPSTMEIIKSRGFLCETYKINMADYHLSLYRIINPLADQNTLNKYPVVYGHGVLFDSSSMISRSENSRPRRPIIGRPSIKLPTTSDQVDDNSLPFMFSNNNFDVWLFDSRGTNYHNRNSMVDVEIGGARRYWDFSLDDQALIDVPSIIDFVLAKTRAQKVVYVGYSESTFFMFALLSTAPEWADKVAAFVAMAPVVYVAHIRGLTVPLIGPMAALVPEFVHTALVPTPVLDMVDEALKNICPIERHICKPLINSVAGLGSGQNAPDLFNRFYQSTSLKALRQFAQLFVGKRFGMYDYGSVENLRRYGQPNPPAYDLSKVRSDRIILVRGLEDFLSDPLDHQILLRELGTKPYKDFPIPKFNHFDFIDGSDLIRLVNAPVMVSVYELLYKDGPNILKNQVQPVNNVATRIDVLPKSAFSHSQPIQGGFPISNPLLKPLELVGNLPQMILGSIRI